MRAKRDGRRLWRVAALLAAGALVAAACGDDDDDGGGAAVTTGPGTTQAGSATTAPEQPKMGGTLTYIHTFEPTNLDPVRLSGATTSGGDGQHAYAIYDSLVMDNPVTGEVDMGTAESFTSNDAVHWTLKLKPNIRFTDGTPYDAEAVKFNWERIADPANRSGNAGATNSIAEMRVVDPLTLEITLKAPNSQFHRGIAKRGGFIGSPTAIRARGEDFGLNPVGAGPFVLKQWLRGSEMRLEKNPDYWNKPRPYVDELIIRTVGDAEQRYNTLKAGQADITRAHTALELVDRARKDGFVIEHMAVGGGTFQLFNTTKPPFDDPKAREAVARSMNRQGYLDTAFGPGLVKAPTHFFPPNSPWHHPGAQYTPYDKDGAQRLLDELAAAGKPVTVNANGSPNTATAVEYFQAQSGEFRNVRWNIEIIPGAESFARAQQKNFEQLSFGMTVTDPEPDFYDFFHSKGARNFFGFSDPDVDQALDRARASLNRAERKAAYDLVQERITRANLFVMFQPQDSNTILAPYVKGYDGFTDGGIPYWDRIWLDK